MTSLRTILSISLLAALSAVGCSAGMTTEEATEACERQRAAQQACFNDQTFQLCVDCHEECGRECTQLESCPLQFSCD